MDDLSRKFRSIDWKGLQKSARKVQASTASALKDMVMTDLENKTRAATADTTWGASGADLMAISHGTYRREDYALIMSIVWQRLASSRWRCVYKSLEVLKFLIMHGAARCAEEARTAQPHIYALKEYTAKDAHGRDVGEGVRTRASLVCDMLTNPDVLEEERAHSRELRAKLQGGSGTAGSLSSDDYRLSGAHGRAGSYGASDDQPSNWNSSDAATRTSTATFKGYGDDDGDTGAASAGYDDEPVGHFTRRAKAAAAVDDLLGDAPDESDDADGARDDDDDDDDDFDPRGTGAAGKNPPSAGGLDDLLAGLGMDDDPVVQTAPAKTSLTTSQLVQQLAAQNEQAGMQLTVVDHSTAGAGGMTNDVSGVQMLSAVSGPSTHGAGVVNGEVDLFRQGSANGLDAFGTAASGTGGKGLVVENGPKKVLSRVTEKEKDPFADLLATGKNSGVL